MKTEKQFKIPSSLTLLLHDITQALSFDPTDAKPTLKVIMKLTEKLYTQLPTQAASAWNELLIHVLRESNHIMWHVVVHFTCGF